MEFDFIYEVLSTNALYSTVAIFFIIDSVVWLGKQLITGLLKVLELMRRLEKYEEH